MAAVDLELDWSRATGGNIRILNSFGRHRFAMFANEGQGVDESDVTIDGNTPSTGPVTCQPIISSSAGPGARRTNYRITINTFRAYGDFVNLRGLSAGTIANNTAVHVLGGGCGGAGVRLENTQQISVTDNTFTNYPKAVLLVGTQNSGTTESGNRL